MSTTIKPINYKEYPECMFAMLAAFMPASEGNDLRRVAGSVIFRSEDDGMTFKNGIVHSFNDEPAIVNGEEFKEWCKDGMWHREGDLPAIIQGGRMEWRNNDVLHREGGPAIVDDLIENGGSEEWWLNGRRHRLGGPAFTNIDIQEWWENGVFIRRERR